MDITAILSGIKGKILDARHIEMLKHAYELQNQNIEQLKNNNDAIRDSNEHLKERIASLTKENEALMAANAILESRHKALPQDGEVSEDAKRILVLLSERDGEEFVTNQIALCLGLSPTKTQYCLDTMLKRKYVSVWCGVGLNGPGERYYSLRDKGRAYLIENGIID